MCFAYRLAFLALALAHPLHAKPADPAIAVDAEGNVRTFHGVPMTLTKDGLKDLPFAVKEVQTQSEGIDDTEYAITTRGNVVVQVSFDDDGKLHGAKSDSPHARDAHGVGVGSTLAEVKAAWPTGSFIYGMVHGGYATFITGSNILYRFDPDDMPKGAFDLETPSDFPVPETIRVGSMSVYPEPLPVTKAVATPDSSKNWITVEQDRKEIMRLDLEQAPGTSEVRITFTREGRVELDRAIDVSAYPDFDIWAREFVYDKEPVVVQFRHGPFKNCGVEEDDRERVYAILSGTDVRLSSEAPPGITLMPSAGLPKRFFIPRKMNGAAHGCRRTFDPATGKFGIGDDQ